MIGCGTTITGQTTGTILNVQSFKHSYGKAEELDTTNFESPDNTMEVELGMDNPGEATMDIIYEKNNNEKLVNAKAARTLETWTVVKTDGSTRAFLAYVTDVTEDIPVKGLNIQTVTLRKTGATTFTKGG